MTFLEEAREIEVKDSYDVIICGGGPAGISAAVSSARNGARTLLVETGGFLGGIWTSGLLSVILDVEGKGGIVQELKTGLNKINAIMPRGNKHNFYTDIEAMKTFLDNLCIDTGVDILFHSYVVNAVKKERNIQGVIIENCEGRIAYTAKNFIDCTGNGDLSAHAGCSWQTGHPVSGKSQPATMQSIVIGVPEFDGNMETYEEKLAFYKMLVKHGFNPSLKAPTAVKLPYGALCALAVNHEFGVKFDSAQSVTKATLNARREINSAVEVLREKAGWKDLRLVSTPSHIGLREGRRILGKYTLTLEDIIKGNRFDDGICLARFAVDIHALDASMSHGYGNDGITVKPYNIPYRSLVSAEYDNLGMAGRCISGDFYAHASYRVTGNALAMGEAIGHAAASAAKNGKSLTEIDGTMISHMMKEKGYEI